MTTTPSEPEKKESEEHTTSAPEDEARAFFKTLFGNKPEGAYILIWTLKDKKSFWATTIDEALAHVEKVKERDTYVGVGLAPGGLKSNQRCKAAEIATVIAFYADIDIAGVGHKKDGLPPDFEAATKLANEMPWGKPTMLVHSGHGLQAYWCLETPLVLPTLAENLKAQVLSRRFGEALKNRAAFYGYTIDSVHDLARVLRVPGTRNRKVDGEEVWAKLLDASGTRYSLEQLEKFLPRGEEPAKGNGNGTTEELAPVVVGDLTLDPSAEPPFEKFNQLGEIDPDFVNVWNMKFKKLKSPSEYDMSLTRRAARAGWTDQEITNLIIAFHRKHKLDMGKVTERKDYVRNTITKIRADEADRPANNATIEEKLVFLSMKLKVSITRVERIIETPIRYKIHIGGSNVVEVKDTEHLTGQRHLRCAIFEVTRKMIPKFSEKKDEWSQIIETIGEVAEDVHISRVSTKDGMTREWVLAYITQQIEYESVRKEYGVPIRDDYNVTNRKPYYHKGYWWIPPGQFLEFAIDTWKLINVDERTMNGRLSDIGGKEKDVNYHRVLNLYSGTKTKDRKQARYWRMPEECGPSVADLQEQYHASFKECNTNKEHKKVIDFPNIGQKTVDSSREGT